MAKQSNKLTAKEVKNLSFDVNGAKKQRHPDGGGLYLLIDDTEAKYWRMDYRRPVTQNTTPLQLVLIQLLALNKLEQRKKNLKRCWRTVSTQPSNAIIKT
jgi:hypothetical protein